MARLKQLPARLSGLAPRVAALPKEAEPFYRSDAWRRYREAHRRWTIARQGGVWCAVCGGTERLILDHKHERKDGGEDLPPFDEAEWLCGRHHNAKTARARGQRARGEVETSPGRRL